MKCSYCGNQFFEGVFCPECGTRYTENIENNVISKPYTPPTSTEINQTEIDEMKHKNELNKAIIGSLNVRGTLYDSLEKAEKAKTDHNKIEILKSKLSNTISQKNRREIITSFENDLTTPDAIYRFEQLKEKSERKFPLSFILYFSLNILNIFNFFLFVFLTSVLPQESVWAALLVFLLFAWFLGVIIWFPWTIVFICQLCSKNFMLKLKHI